MNGTQYKPAWADHNGIQGRFAVFNVNPGTSVSMKIHAVDPETDKEITVPHVAFTFFDLDTGEDNVKSVEYIKVRGHAKYYLSNETEVNVTHESDGWTMFKATKEGTGDDNPSDPTALSPLQKNRAVTFIMENFKEIEFEAGATEGQKPRVFSFVARPSLLCAYTEIDDNTVLAASDPASPIHAVPGGSCGQRQGIVLLIGLLLFILELLN